MQQPWVIAHSGGGPLQSHPATIQYIGILGDAQREIEMLLYEHDADLMSQIAQTFCDLLDDADPHAARRAEE